MSRHAVSIEIDGQVGVLDHAALHVERRERRAELQRDLELLSIFIAAGVGLEGLQFVLERFDGVCHRCRLMQREAAGAKAAKAVVAIAIGARIETVVARGDELYICPQPCSLTDSVRAQQPIFLSSSDV